MRKYNPRKYPIVCGVYCIENVQNSKKYIGKSDNILARWDEHKHDLSKNQHHNRHLQAAWNQYGSACFKFSIIEQCSSGDVALQREKHWIDYYSTFGENGYNLCEGGLGASGICMSNETKAHISKMMVARMTDPNERIRLSEAHSAMKKPIIQINISTNEPTSWDSASEAARALGIPVAGIHSCLKGKVDIAIDSLWFYKGSIDENTFNAIEYLKQQNSPSVYNYLKYYQYDFLGKLQRIWTTDELIEAGFKTQCVYLCCNHQRKKYRDSIWLFEHETSFIKEIRNDYQKEREFLCYPIYVYDATTLEKLMICKNMKECQDKYNIRSIDIRKCCYGINRMCKGYIFKFADYEDLYDRGRQEGLSKREKQMSHIKKQVNQYDLSMNLIKTWDSVTQVIEYLHCGKSTINRYLHSDCSPFRGYIWQYTCLE